MHRLTVVNKYLSIYLSYKCMHINCDMDHFIFNRFLHANLIFVELIYDDLRWCDSILYFNGLLITYDDTNT